MGGYRRHRRQWVKDVLVILPLLVFRAESGAEQ